VNKVNWRGIDTVLLDMDGTLLDLHYDNFFWREHVPLRYAERHGLEQVAAREKLFDHYQRHAGTLNWYCVDFWSRELALDIVTLKEEVAHLIAVHPDVQEFLQAVRAAGKRVALVTNAHRKSLDLKMRRTGLVPYFDAVITAHALGLPKEEPKFWEALRAAEPFDPAHTLLVDDSLSVLESARAYGIANLLSIRQPDSRQPPREELAFAALHSFRELLPVE
jgi:GMP/IMP 5'-nucleotidase